MGTIFIVFVLIQRLMAIGTKAHHSNGGESPTRPRSWLESPSGSTRGEPYGEEGRDVNKAQTYPLEREQTLARCSAQGPDRKLLHRLRVEVKAGRKEQWEQTGKRALPSACRAARSAPTKPPFLSSKASAPPTPSHACIL